MAVATRRAAAAAAAAAAALCLGAPPLRAPPLRAEAAPRGEGEAGTPNAPGSNENTAKWRVLTHRALELARRRGALGEAEALLREALAAARRGFGERDAHVGAALSNLADMMRLRGRHAEARALLRESLAVLREAEGKESVAVALAMHRLGAVWLAEGSPREAEAELKRALALLRPQVGDSHPAVADTLATLAEAHAALKNTKAEAAALQEAVSQAHERGAALAPATLKHTARLGAALERAGELQKAEAVRRRAHSAAQAAAREDATARNVGGAMFASIALAGTLRLRATQGSEQRGALPSCSPPREGTDEAEALREARQLLEAAFKAGRERFGESDLAVGACERWLALVLAEAGDVDAAAKVAKSAVATLERCRGEAMAAAAAVKAAEAKGLPPPSQLRVVSLRAATKELGEALRLTADLAEVEGDAQAQARAHERLEGIGQV